MWTRPVVLKICCQATQHSTDNTQRTDLSVCVYGWEGGTCLCICVCLCACTLLASTNPPEQVHLLMWRCTIKRSIELSCVSKVMLFNLFHTKQLHGTTTSSQSPPANESVCFAAKSQLSASQLKGGIRGSIPTLLCLLLNSSRQIPSYQLQRT